MRNGLLAGVDHVRVGLVFRVGIRTDAHESIFRLQLDDDAVGDVVAGHGGHADAQIHVHAGPKFLGRAAHDPSPSTLDDAGLLLRIVVLIRQPQPLNGLVVDGGLNDLVDKHAAQMNLIRRQSPRWNNLLCLHQSEFPSHGGVGVGIAGRPAEYEVAVRIGHLGLDEANVRPEGVLQYILDAVKYPRFSGLGRHAHRLSTRIVGKLDGNSTLGINGSRAGGGVKGRYARTRRPQPFGNGPLRRQLDGQPAAKVFLFEISIFAHITADERLDHTGF